MERYNKLFQLYGIDAWNYIISERLSYNNCLAIAYLRNDFELFKKLIDNGASVFATNEILRGPNFIAFDKIDKMNFLEYAYSKLKDIDQFDEYNRLNLLLFHTYTGNYGAVELLIKLGADVNVVDKEGITPFYNACRSGNVEVVKLLLSCEPNNIYDCKNGCSSGIKEAQGLKKYDVVVFLLENGYHIELIPDLYNFIYEVAFKKDILLANLLVKRNIDISKVKFFKNDYTRVFEEHGVVFEKDIIKDLNKLLREGKTTTSIVEKLTQQRLYENKENDQVKYIDVVKVKYFPNAYKEYTFLSDGIQCNVGDRVLVYTNGQKQEVIVSKANFKTTSNQYNFALKSIISKV